MSNEFEIFMLAKVNEHGVIEGLAKKKLASQLHHFAGKPIELIIRRKKKYRSIQQNRFLWLSYNLISDHTGFTPNECHEIFKGLFLKAEKVNDKTGTLFQYTRSTTELSTTEFMEYIESIVKFCAEEFQITMPMPNQQIEVFN